MQHAALAVYMGLAAWQTLRSDQTQAIRQMLEALRTSPKPCMRDVAHSLLRVFALKEMFYARDVE